MTQGYQHYLELAEHYAAIQSMAGAAHLLELLIEKP